ncbi:TetR/AcrR family transcriptional regulator [Arthrobacter sp. efr-133-TYG-118]|uniref:TetR/AcrR family transcriptional regulator n=1 Tax=Arthrobacter sp. efr-133-TYG-118 TaxID=3040279 RepID=UPI00254B8969|nr:TetR/AcrR family transcriptional regulator [Arthrobacter sp. efr-133-TYG-118]
MTAATEKPVSTNLRERRREQTRIDLTSAGLEIISAEGVEAATIDRLAAQAGMSRGTVYAHFEGGRDELLQEAYRRVGRDLVGTAQRLADSADTWQDRVMAYARAMVALTEDHNRGYFYNVAGPALFGSRVERGEGSSASLAAIRKELLLAHQRGEIDSDVDADGMAVLLIGCLREAGIEIAREAMQPARFLSAFQRLLDGLTP